MATSTTSATSGTGGVLSSLGVGSGIDINSLVTQLVTAEMQPDAARIARDTKQVGTQLTAVGQLKGALAAFQTSLNSLNAQSDFQVKSATPGDSKIFTASASSTAAPGTYKIEIGNLASAQQLRSTFAPVNGTATVGTGTLTLGLGTKTFAINLDDSHSSLNAVRDAINSATDNPGISATIINGTNSAQLVLTSSTTGAANKITVVASGGNGGLSALAYSAGDTSHYASLQEAKDSSITVAGVTVTNATNTVTTAIDGVTLNLLTTTAADTPVLLTVTNDTNTVVNRVQNFVSSYNALQGVIAKLGNYDSASQTGGPLLGDALLNGISSQIRHTLSNPVASGGSQYNTLASLGITTNKDGTLTLDATKLNTALTNNFNAVSAVFGATDGVASSLSKYVDKQLSSGSSIDARNQSLSTRQKQITDRQATIAARQAQITARYTAQFTAMDKALAQMQQTSSYLTQQFNTLAKITNSNNG